MTPADEKALQRVQAAMASDDKNAAASIIARRINVARRMDTKRAWFCIAHELYIVDQVIAANSTT